MLRNNSIQVKHKLIIESFIVFLILLAPFLYKFHTYLPDKPDEVLTVFGFTIDSHGFYDVETYVWFLLSKFIPFYLIMIWFLTCKHWWYHILLIPLTMYSFQLFELYYSADEFVDTKNLLWLLPICMVIIPLVYFIRIRLYDRFVHGIDLGVIEQELDLMKEKEALEKEREILNIRKERFLKSRSKNERILFEKND